MIEIRAVRTDELEVMLAVMCEAFSLPFAPARDIFLHDPYFDVDKKRVLVLNGAVVSCLTVVDTTLWIGDAPVEIAGIANVATRQSHRGHGYASQLIKGTIPALYENGYGFSALLPYSYAFYRKLGWELAGRQLRLTLDSRILPDYTEARHVRLALPSDRAEIDLLYSHATRGRTGYPIRDEKRWTYLFDHVKSKIVYKRDQLEGYAFFDMSTEDNASPSLRLLELHAETDAARRGLIGYFARRVDEVKTIEYTAGWDELHASGLMNPLQEQAEHPGARLDVLPGVMFRIIDLRQALEDLKPNFAGYKGEVTLVMEDPLSPSRSCLVATLEGDGGSIDVRPADGRENARKRIEGDVRVWSQVLSGWQSLDDALSLNRLHSYSPAAAKTASLLFPHRDPFIPVADHF